MKVLVLGSNGLLGHKVYQVLGQRFDVTGTIRGARADITRFGIFRESSIIPGVEATEITAVEKAIIKIGPEAVVNCVGVVKSLSEKSGVMANIWLNSLFPHQLYRVCRDSGARLIHVSTDCVFSGRKGRYVEDNPSDADDIYGKTKYLGEVTGPGAVTIRTSFIGRELASANGLLEWFIGNQGGTVNGYSGAVFSGFPTLHLARIVTEILEHHRDLTGLYHVSSQPISKHQLLVLINKAMRLNIKVNRSPEPRYDRSLDSTRYRMETGFVPLSWEEMVEEMARDAEPYRQWR